MSLPSTKSANTPLKSVDQNAPKSPASSVKKTLPSAADTVSLKKHVSKASGDATRAAEKVPKTPSVSTAPSVSDVLTPTPKLKSPTLDLGTGDTTKKIVKKKKKPVESTDVAPQVKDAIGKAKKNQAVSTPDIPELKPQVSTIKKSIPETPTVPDVQNEAVDQVKEKSRDAIETPKRVKKKKRLVAPKPEGTPNVEPSEQIGNSVEAIKKSKQPSVPKADIPDTEGLIGQVKDKVESSPSPDTVSKPEVLDVKKQRSLGSSEVKNADISKAANEDKPSLPDAPKALKGDRSNLPNVDKLDTPEVLKAPKVDKPDVPKASNVEIPHLPNLNKSDTLELPSTEQLKQQNNDKVGSATEVSQKALKKKPLEEIDPNPEPDTKDYKGNEEEEEEDTEEEEGHKIGMEDHEDDEEEADYEGDEDEEENEEEEYGDDEDDDGEEESERSEEAAATGAPLSTVSETTSELAELDKDTSSKVPEQAGEAVDSNKMAAQDISSNAMHSLKNLASAPDKNAEGSLHQLSTQGKDALSGAAKKTASDVINRGKELSGDAQEATDFPANHAKKLTSQAKDTIGGTVPPSDIVKDPQAGNGAGDGVLPSTDIVRDPQTVFADDDLNTVKDTAERVTNKTKGATDEAQKTAEGGVNKVKGLTGNAENLGNHATDQVATGANGINIDTGALLRAIKPSGGGDFAGKGIEINVQTTKEGMNLTIRIPAIQ